MFRRGHFYWGQMPGEGKRRPVLVLSADRRNDRSERLVVIPVATTRRMGPWSVSLRRGEGGLLADSVAQCEEITGLGKHRFLPKALGGPLAPKRLMEIRAAILRALDYE